ncbi:MAG TPA: cyclic nucleotide-binding domain-containing protein [Bauldia sp.]|nr:cyclic nucleotide-binding domain-containing protein [Bauldia sp.]
MEPRDVLKSVPFFADVLDDAELDELAAHAHFIRYPQGSKPIEEDAPGHAMFIIVSGKAHVTVHGEDAAVAELGRGDIAGEMSLLTGARRSATITATTPLEVIEVNKQALAHVLKDSPDLVDRFAALIDRRQRELDRLAGGNAWGTMRLGKAEMAATIRSFFANTI